jgi:hypothetical protein
MPAIIVSTNLTTKSKNFLKYYQSWQKCRDVYEGEDVIHAKGTAYLPKLQSQTPGMYELYKQRTRFFNVFKRTIKGLNGMVIRKDSILEQKNIPDEIVDDITLTGESMDSYAKGVLADILTIGIGGTLVDHPIVDDAITIAEKNSNNIRPNLVYYTGEQIINHEYAVINGVKALKLVVLEQQSSKSVDIFKKEYTKQYLVLLLDEMDDGRYHYRNVLFEESNKSYSIVHDTYPLMDGAPITKIPFFFHGEYNYPPLYDLCTTNIKHYQLKADHNHCLHYIGLPTPVITGVDPTDENRPRTLGPEEIIYIADPSARASYLELEGKALGELTNELAKLESDMAHLGASMLTADQNTNETARKASIRHSIETSALGVLVSDINKSISKALQFLSIWNDTDPDVYYHFNTDFDPIGLTAQDILALVSSWQNGAFSKTTLFGNLKRGEVILDGRTFEEEEDLINQGQ